MRKLFFAAALLVSSMAWAGETESQTAPNTQQAGPITVRCAKAGIAGYNPIADEITCTGNQGCCIIEVIFENTERVGFQLQHPEEQRFFSSFEVIGYDPDHNISIIKLGSLLNIE